MSKIGKITLTALIMGFFFAFPAAAQQRQAEQPGVQQNPVAQQRQAVWTKADLQSIYIEHLRQEGYLPAVDADGDIQFKVSGDNYFIIIDEKDLQFFQIYLGFSLGAIKLEDALNAANYSNRHSKVAKVSISSDGRVANVTTELLLNDPRDFTLVFTRAISLIRNAEGIFLEQLK